MTIRSDHLTVRARRAIVAIPLAIANSIDYEPVLPVDRALLHHRMPSGAVYKISIVYDEPFWRADGLSGQSAAPVPRHVDHRRLHGHRGAGNHVRHHRGTCRAPAGAAR
ncbi:flavin containing amine oxidoreductase family protein [Mycobacterium kansasii]|uniref:Flavin containing amine oxidoreductase family protein n=1 Tax=Mycobacterium kansasii TaxID=1768 RepID=A0A1V3XNU8_MYCKA|nr:flavin containing amine oxidoreductase family protein [Mycobacterium kansasii]